LTPDSDVNSHYSDGDAGDGQVLRPCASTRTIECAPATPAAGALTSNRLVRPHRREHPELAVAGLRGFCFVATPAAPAGLPDRATCGSLGEPFDAAETAGSERRHQSRRQDRRHARISGSTSAAAGAVAQQLPMQRSGPRGKAAVRPKPTTLLWPAPLRIRRAAFTAPGSSKSVRV
jgi:hypothetical protein